MIFKVFLANGVGENSLLLGLPPYSMVGLFGTTLLSSSTESYARIKFFSRFLGLGPMIFCWALEIFLRCIPLDFRLIDISVFYWACTVGKY